MEFLSVVSVVLRIFSVLESSFARTGTGATSVGCGSMIRIAAGSEDFAG
jgi:hypothetical protein